ncbi:MAG: phosphoglycerate kinase [Candidatus Nanoarchaeia archaeon]|nr:phosphoglycerate kinase [Candidatus Nanoarchaeia archaeon]
MIPTNLKTLYDIKNLENKKVLLRVDYNVPLEGNIVKDDTRIVESLATIKYLLNHNCKISMISHLGRPDGKRDEKYSLKPVYNRFLEILKKEKINVSTKFYDEIENNQDDVQIKFYENTRFYYGDEICDENFSQTLFKLGEIFVNDAFSLIHREHASNYGVAMLMPTYCGFLIEKELRAFQKLENPVKPYIAIMGGAKISDKLKIIKNLIEKVDYILIGGAMAFTFLKAYGLNVGKSPVEEDMIKECEFLLATKKIILPIDFVGQEKFEDIKGKNFDCKNFPDNYLGLDIGKKSIDLFKEFIKSAHTIFWNGPMGVFEFENYNKATLKIAKMIAKNKMCHSVVGGGDSVYAINKLKLEKGFSWISTGGGASLKLVSGSNLKVLDTFNKDVKE